MCAAARLKTDADVEVLDRDVHVATVSEGGRLSIEMRLKVGRGYVSADKNFRRGSGARLHPHRFGPLARPQGQLLGGGRAPRPDD